MAEKTARYRIMVDTHETVRPTGLQRTYPNWLACEAARGNEFNAWSAGNPPERETVLPLTRLVGGPTDYTPGIFQIKMDHYEPGRKEQVHTTLAKQLALYMTMYSPFQMAADLPENYERFPDAFQLIKDVAVDWDDTRILEAEPGDYVTIARKARDGDEWYVGAITDENARTATIPLDYLPAGRLRGHRLRRRPRRALGAQSDGVPGPEPAGQRPDGAQDPPGERWGCRDLPQAGVRGRGPDAEAIREPLLLRNQGGRGPPACGGRLPGLARSREPLGPADRGPDHLHRSPREEGLPRGRQGPRSGPLGARGLPPEAVGRTRDPLAPLQIEQRLGPGFKRDGNQVSWDRWRFHVRVEPRRGAVIAQVAYLDGERARPVL